MLDSPGRGKGTVVGVLCFHGGTRGVCVTGTFSGGRTHCCACKNIRVENMFQTLTVFVVRPFKTAFSARSAPRPLLRSPGESGPRLCGLVGPPHAVSMQLLGAVCCVAFSDSSGGEEETGN